MNYKEELARLYDKIEVLELEKCQEKYIVKYRQEVEELEAKLKLEKKNAS